MSFAYINPKNSLEKDVEVHRLVAKILEKISDIPKHQEYKYSLELLKMICLMIEHGIDNKGKKVKTNKKDIVFQVFNKLWTGITPLEIKAIDANIEFLWENGFIVRKGWWSIIKHSVADWFSRKILN